MKGVGAEHQMLMSASSICECEHSHLYVSLISARLGRATPFKKRKRLQILWSRRQSRKSHPGPDFYITNLRIIILLMQEILEEIGGLVGIRSLTLMTV